MAVKARAKPRATNDDMVERGEVKRTRARTKLAYVVLVASGE